MFVDRVEIEVRSGRGGDGCVSFRREKFVPRGGPNGGDGGHGGSVIIEARMGVDSLSALVHQKQWKADNGKPGQGSNRHGKTARNLQILVPPGTIVIDAESGLVLKDLKANGELIHAVRGGYGGKGNARFKSSTNRSPRDFTPGGESQSRRVILELKVIADVGLIGLPNAGKSTLLSRLSSARPEIANYPFTTKKPNLGIVSIDSDRSFVAADIPGLIEGAHQGHGLGHEFLRHIQRAGILVHLVEPEPFDATDPITNYYTIRNELREYDVELDTRPEIVVISKSELPESETVRKRLEDELRGGEGATKVLAISSATGSGLRELVGRITRLLEESGKHFELW